MILKSGDHFAGYDVLEPAGRGAMAATYKARRVADRRTVALKIPKSSYLMDPTFVVRFLQEAHLGTRLQNKYVTQVYEAGEVDGMPFIAMEYLEGMTLKDGLAASGRVAVRRALQIAHDISSALDHAHARGIVHRDLKPENVMLRVGKCLKVMDFGIAKVVGEIGVTTSNMFIGSPSYAAPEMIDSSSVDHRVDLYSLGIMLFEMLQGEVPFAGNSAVEILLLHRTDPLPSLADMPYEVPRNVWRLVEILAEKEPERRLPNARSVRLAIEILLRE